MNVILSSEYESESKVSTGSFPVPLFILNLPILLLVVATTRPMSNSNTTSKSQRWISNGEHELCNSQENLTRNYNSILLTIYITIHGPCYDYISAVCPTLMSMPYPHIYY